MKNRVVESRATCIYSDDYEVSRLRASGVGELSYGPRPVLDELTPS